MRGATLEEIDLASNVWTIPASRMKAAVQHRVPLSRQAVALLRALPREASFVFIGAKANATIGEGAMRRVLTSLRPGVTAHGFRSSFRDWCEERTSYPTVVAEQALAHTISDETERAYRPTDLFDKRTHLMQLWSDYCDTPVGAANIVRSIRSSAPSPRAGSLFRASSPVLSRAPNLPSPAGSKPLTNEPFKTSRRREVSIIC